jgi:hypothetical protein
MRNESIQIVTSSESLHGKCRDCPPNPTRLRNWAFFFCYWVAILPQALQVASESKDANMPNILHSGEHSFDGVAYANEMSLPCQGCESDARFNHANQVTTNSSAHAPFRSSAVIVQRINPCPETAGRALARSCPSTIRISGNVGVTADSSHMHLVSADTRRLGRAGGSVCRWRLHMCCAG